MHRCASRVHFRYWGVASYRSELFSALLHSIILRCNYGILLERLQSWQCEYTIHNDARCLREIVLKVDWNTWERELSTVDG